ncbi:D-alanyl-D-alanine carboxypeptidase/D-alanyl-D-alanine-endopeptidase [Chitinimonas viridis]|uniref:D-alanyl-D-alanine carboxypeptidase/D-alanyl-D-alanine-endopeptidase n=1 Tax=Chitinimonas viridis TaxID=664880 RepID=A0ABT8B3X1_9NEIS|nr:D-alanyl-D-alanine carboxypeptidase/D-alanyl-D-alanine-endopeptidase [Chitinimonas viridis]MDN3576346.1 D-alanyl-D-alanine carboxypeptidase/D-alanyl-D-alanine-endopeptidase [Chitinimonas viridis]
MAIRTSLAAWAAVLLCNALPASAALPEMVASQLKQAKVPENAMAAVVMPLAGEGARLLHQPDTPFNPASTIKLLSTLAALETLGPSHSWHTGLYSKGGLEGDTLKGDLYLRGGGDPKLTFERLWLLLRELRARGVRRIEGDLVLDRSYFVLPPDLAASQFDEQPERAYNVGPDALLANFRAQRFDMESGADSMLVRIEPPLAGLVADSRMKLVDGDCTRWARGWARPDIERLADGRVKVTLQGSFPRHCRAGRYLSLFGTVDFTSRLLRSLWQELGGEITGTTREATTPQDARLWAEQVSPPLAEQLRDINKLSNNTMARSVYLTMGAEQARALNWPPGMDSQQAAEAALLAWLARQGLSMPGLVVDNGAGLSRTARISARQLASVLAVGQRSAFAAEYLASLPIVALDGTMRRRLAGTPLAGRARIKTGTLDGVKAVAGYVTDTAGQAWLVVGMINHPRADEAQAALDALLEWAACNDTCPQAGQASAAAPTVP